MSDNWRDEMLKKQALDAEQRNREVQKQAAEEAWRSLFDPRVGLFPMMKRQDEERMLRQQELMAEEQARAQREDEYARQRSESTDPEWLRRGRDDSGGYAAMTAEERRDGLLDSWATNSRGSDLKPDPLLEQDRQAGVTEQLRSQEDQKQAADEAWRSLFDPRVGLFPMMKRQDEERMLRQQELMAEEQARAQREDEYARQRSESTDPEWLRRGRDDSGGYAAMTAEERRESMLASWSRDSTGNDGKPESKQQEEQAETLGRIRGQEDQEEYARADWSYWWDPVRGFWAWMKRQDEEREDRQRELLTEERARQDRQPELQAEGQARQEHRQKLTAEPQGGSEERLTDIDEPRPLNGEGVDYAAMSSEERRESLLDSWETSPLPVEEPALEQQLRAQEGSIHMGADNQESQHQRRNDGAERKAFREYVIETINAGCDGKDHPLRNLLDQSGKAYAARDMYDFANPIFDAGHLVTRHGGGTALGVEWSADNRLDGVHSERKGIIMEKAFVDVKGIPIELGMLKTLEHTGLVPPGTVEASKPSRGWGDCRTDR